MPLVSSAGVTLTQLKGVASVRRPNQASWNQVPVNYVLQPGDELKTSRGGSATLAFDDGSRIELGPNSSYTLEDAQEDKSVMSLSFGSLKAWVTTLAKRRFAVRTPTAVCSVRGTEFGVDVARDGSTQVALFKGLLGVADQKGNELLLKPGQHIGVTLNGLGKLQGAGERRKAERTTERDLLKREVGLDMSKAQVLAMAAQDIRQAVYKEGKTMVDVEGNRVRIEDYILRPSPNEFRFVVVNERQSRFDYFMRDGIFNTTLPDDLSTAFRQLPGCIGAPCQWYMTTYTTVWSNTQDNVHEVATGGHLVDVNHNGVAGNAVTTVFDPGSNGYVNLAAGTPFYTTLFDGYTLKFDGVEHTGWTPDATKTVNALNALVPQYYSAANPGCPANGVGAVCGGIQSMGDSNGTGDQRSIDNLATTTSIIAQPNCTSLDECTGNRDPGLFHDIIYREHPGGATWDKFDNYIVDDNGNIATWGAFGGAKTSGSNFVSNLLNWNYQQIITASEFQGRKIDLVFEPKILVEAGLVQ